MLTRPIFGWARSALPTMSDTERAAIEAGEVWWDAEIFSGNPDWQKLLNTPPARLSTAEQNFLDGPVRELAAMLDEWRLSWEDGDLPEQVWDFMRTRKFFGMIIPEDYGGLGFSAYAQSEVIRVLSMRSIAGAVTVMVPNSLGPGELLMMFGTEAQRKYWLPRLADGREIPCFGLTSREAGSDAAAMTDTGVVCRGEFEGRDVLGIRLNWRKRYITLAPVATVLGLAFKLHDPDRLLGGDEDRGITVALVQTDLSGITRGRRHLPALQFFQNGPIDGRDVFIPLDNIIGGADQVGQGWPMLMSALAAGRGISLPSLSAAGVAFSAHTSGAYARVRTQFGLPIGRFEGVQECLGRLAGTTYLLDAARRLTCAAIDEGRAPAVVSAIMKAQATYRLREAVSDAMDIHSGKTVMEGPRNYLGGLWRSIPIAIAVEGANILTRNLIIFGQGSIRCHPHLLDEIVALNETDRDKALDDFDRAFWRHLGHALVTLLRAWGRSWSRGLFAPAPDAGVVTGHYRQLSRYAACLALASELALLTLGGALKRKETISARLGDVLSELYLLSAVLKRWKDEGAHEADLVLVNWCMADGLARIERSLDEVFANMPSRFAGGLLRFLMPGSSRRRGPADTLTQACAELLLQPSDARDRLVSRPFGGLEGEAVHTLEHAFALAVEVEPIRRKLREASVDAADATSKGLVSAQEASRLAEADDAAAQVIEVDDFPAEELSGARPATRREAEAAAPLAQTGSGRDRKRSTPTQVTGGG